MSSDKRALGVAIALALAFFLQGLLGNTKKSLTWDEPSFIAAGYAYLAWGDFRFNPSHPPLLQQLEALPLTFMDLDVPARDAGWHQLQNPVVGLGRKLIYDSGNDPVRIAFWSRLPILLLGTGLVFGMFLWGRRLYGATPALLGTAIAAFSPNLLAHAKVATEDLGCAALMFASVWAFWRATRSDRLRDWVVCGVVTGLALLAKYTALLLGPIYVLIVGLLWLCRRDAIRPVAVLKGGAIVGALSVLCVGAGYDFSFDWSWYLDGIRKIYTDLQPGYRYYFLGEVSDQPRWYYHLAAFALKVPESTQLLIAFAVAGAIIDRQRLEATVFLLVPAAVVLVTSCFDRENFGLRRILPAFPFLLLFASQAVSAAKKPSVRWALLALVGWTAVQALSVFPHHLAYFNTPAGGPERAPYLLDDSNIDWGQDLPALAAWQRAHPEAGTLKLMYFGTAAPAAYDVDSVPMPQRDVASPVAGTYAISAHILAGFRKLQRDVPANIDWLTKYQPIGRAGYSIYLYRF